MEENVVSERGNQSLIASWLHYVPEYWEGCGQEEHVHKYHGEDACLDHEDSR